MPSNKNGAAHWPTNKAVCDFFRHFKVSDTPIDASAAIRKTDDGTAAVLSSIISVRWPSLWVLVVFILYRFLLLKITLLSAWLIASILLVCICNKEYGNNNYYDNRGKCNYLLIREWYVMDTTNHMLTVFSVSICATDGLACTGCTAAWGSALQHTTTAVIHTCGRVHM